uniref:Uncharacterized protein n=1 Tax=Arundo donax TaxID=35708 RepID=A0A0A8ZL28_ARUDO
MRQSTHQDQSNCATIEGSLMEKISYITTC